MSNSVIEAPAVPQQSRVSETCTTAVLEVGRDNRLKIINNHMTLTSQGWYFDIVEIYNQILDNSCSFEQIIKNGGFWFPKGQLNLLYLTLLSCVAAFLGEWENMKLYLKRLQGEMR